MYINYLDNFIELKCTGVEISDDELGIQILFKGANIMDYFLIQRHFDEDDDIDIFYTEGCDNTGYWTFVKVTIGDNFITFSQNKIPVKIFLDLNSKKYARLIEPLRRLIGLIGTIVEKGSS